ncbi:MAG: OmpA family protein [Acidobacteriota bacterium]
MSVMNQKPDPTSGRGARKGRLTTALLALLGLGLVAAVFYFSFSLQKQIGALSSQVVEATRRIESVARKSEAALERAERAERNALLAARGRVEAEAARAEAEQEANQARRQANQARETVENVQREAKLARQETERLRREREAELNRLQQALDRIAETRRTALGLVMNLGSDSLQFDFDKATLRPENRELLSRIAGILLTSARYAIYVYGHTDDIGSDEYNQDLSERRAEAVRDYLVEAGIDPNIISAKGFGKSNPIVAGTSPRARAKNRRVEIGIVNTHINYEGRAGKQP